MKTLSRILLLLMSLIFFAVTGLETYTDIQSNSNISLAIAIAAFIVGVLYFMLFIKHCREGRL